MGDIMKISHLFALLLLSVGPWGYPAHAAPPQSTVTTPSGVQGPGASSGKRHVVQHPVAPDDSQQTPGAAGSPGTEPNGSNNAQLPNGNNDAQNPDGSNNAQNPDDGNNGADSGGGSPGVTITDE